MTRFLSALAWLLTAILAAGLASCRGVAAPTGEPVSSYVYVTNEISGDLSVIDPATGSVVETIALGKRPRGIRVSPDRRLLYIALSGSPLGGPNIDRSSLPPADKRADGIGVFDISRNELVRVLVGGSDPEQLEVSSDGTRLYVANEDTGQVSIVDVASNRVVRMLAVGEEPEGVGISPDGRTVYVTSESASEIFVIDTETERVVKSFEVGRRPRAIAFCHNRPRAFVTAENEAAVSVVDTSRHEVEQTIHLPGDMVRPMGVAVAPDDARIYVTTGRGRKLFAVDVETLEILGSVEVGERPWGVAISADGRTVYTANGPSNDVSVVDAATLQVVSRIEVGAGPWGVTIVH